MGRAIFKERTKTEVDFSIYINRAKTIENDMKIVLEDVCNDDMVSVDDYIDILLWCTQLKLLYEYFEENDVEYDKGFAQRVTLFLAKTELNNINPYKDGDKAFKEIMVCF